MDIDDIDFEDNIYRLSEMNSIYENMLDELDKITIELNQIDDEIEEMNFLNSLILKTNNRIEKEKKRFRIREILFSLSLITISLIFNPSNIALLTLFIPSIIGGTVFIYNSYLANTKWDRFLLTDYYDKHEKKDNDNYDNLIRKQKEIRNKQVIKKQNAFSYKKSIAQFANDINHYQTEFNIYDRAISSQNSRKSENDKKYCYILKKNN